MKPFYYYQDPMYSAAAAILSGQTVTEEALQLSEASAATTLDDFRSGPEILGALLKLPGVKEHLRKINAKPYFDDDDFIVASKTAISGALFNPKVKLADLAKAVMAEQGDSKKAETEAMPNRVIVSVGNEAGVRKILDMIKANNAKAPSKDMKVTAQKFVRKGGFKVYITGNSVQAIGPYKKMAEESELLYGQSLDENVKSTPKMDSLYAKLRAEKEKANDLWDKLRALRDRSGTYDHNQADAIRAAANKQEDIASAVHKAYQQEHEREDAKQNESVDVNEGVEDIAMAVANFKKGDKTNFGVVTDVGQHSISFKAKDLPVTKIAFNQRKMGSKDFVLDKLVKLKEEVSLEEAVKANDPANLRSIIANHTALLNKATDSKAKEFHRVAIANAKEKLKSLGESELDEAYKVGFPLAKKAIKAATDLDPDEFKQFLGGMADYFYDVAAMDDGDPEMSRSYIVKTAVHFEQAYKGWKPE